VPDAEDVVPEQEHRDGGVREDGQTSANGPTSPKGTFTEKLLFPVLVAAANAAFAWFFDPHIANGWQDRQHAFATRSALVDKLSLASAQLMSAVQTREFKRRSEPDKSYLMAFRTWDTMSQVIDAEIATYFADGNALAAKWRHFADKMREYHNLPDQQKPKAPRKGTLTALATYVGAPTLVKALFIRPPHPDSSVSYQQAWVDLKDRLIEKRDAIVEALVRSRIPTSAPATPAGSP
jgi:hypothetical protein